MYIELKDPFNLVLQYYYLAVVLKGDCPLAKILLYCDSCECCTRKHFIKWTCLPSNCTQTLCPHIKGNMWSSSCSKTSLSWWNISCMMCSGHCTGKTSSSSWMRRMYALLLSSTFSTPRSVILLNLETSIVWKRNHYVLNGHW